MGKMGKTFDFSGWATKNNLRCSDGRTILKDAFKENNGQTVPLVWNHQHNDPKNVLGHALLENREEGVYAYCTLNDTSAGKDAKLLVQHGDVSALSIYANQLKQVGGNVLHGAIREVSLVLAGANPGASIDSIIRHGEVFDEEAIIYTGEEISLEHAFGENPAETIAHAEEPKKKEAEEKKSESGKTVKDVFDTLNEEQKTVVYALVGQALEDKGGAADDDDEEKDDMKHNVFDGDIQDDSKVLSHAEMTAIINDGKRFGSLKESALQHGIEEIETLFPEPKNLNNPPEWLSREMDWVKVVMGGVHHTPFSRIKSTYADITGDEARARGYIKGKLKKEEVFSLLRRTTTPQTVYKKQKLDRDDIIDITDFDVISWLKAEMRTMLDEELARAFLIGDGRLGSDDDKIQPTNIRPIAYDADLYTIHYTVKQTGTDEDADARALIKAAVKARKDYKGSGNPILFTTEDILTNMLLIEDLNKRVVYDSVDKLATAMRVSRIVTVPVMEGAKTQKGKDLLGVIVNLSDYNVGADKGGAVNMFDDFDIDYNAQKYLIETRCSGALVKPFSAIALESDKNIISAPEHDYAEMIKDGSSNIVGGTSGPNKEPAYS